MLGITQNETKRNMNDGFFEVNYRPDGVFLTVFPSVGSGKKVEVREVLDRITRKRLRNFSREAIDLATFKADKTPCKIANVQEEERIDATIVVSTTTDKMKAFVIFSPPEGGRMLNMEEILQVLGKNGIIFGINKTTLDTIIKYPVYNEMICIAEGIPSVNGQNGKVEFLFDISKENKPTILEDGRVDYRELNLIISAQKGQKLCFLIPPLSGTPGKTVMGIDIAALNGKPANLPRGKNVEITPDGQELISCLDGEVSYLEGKVSVYANYEVPADVDTHTGNIYFVGNVIIRGNVLSGYTVEAGGNVEVWGGVEGATIKAAGDIILKRGMQGMGKGVLISGGDIVARYIEHSSIEAKRDIKTEAIMHSNVKCGNKLEVGGRKGLLVGGIIKVGKEINAKVIGSNMATVTDIEVGVDPTIRERHKQLKEEINTAETDMKKAEQAIALLKKLESQAPLSADKQEIMSKSVRTKFYYSNRINEIKEEVGMIEASLQQEGNGKIRASGYIYPGTRIAIGSCMMYVKENLQYCTVYRDGADIRIGSIDR